MKYIQIVLLAIIGITCLMCTHKHKCCNNKQTCDNEELTKADNNIGDIEADSSITLEDKSIMIDSLLTLSKGACFGKCPVYKLLITQSGQIFLHRKMFIEPQGKFKGQLSSSELKDILVNINALNYFELEQYYPSNQKYFISDLPNTNTAVYMGGKVHKIFNNNSAPNSLMDFEKYIVDLILNHTSLTIDHMEEE